MSDDEPGASVEVAGTGRGKRLTTGREDERKVWLRGESHTCRQEMAVSRGTSDVVLGRRMSFLGATVGLKWQQYNHKAVWGRGETNRNGQTGSLVLAWLLAGRGALPSDTDPLSLSVPPCSSLQSCQDYGNRAGGEEMDILVCPASLLLETPLPWNPKGCPSHDHLLWPYDSSNQIMRVHFGGVDMNVWWEKCFF